MFFCKRKTAYDMRISDWSSDVCSSDLDDPIVVPPGRYDVRASEGSDEATLTGSLRVIETTTDVPATIALPGRPPRPNPCAILADPTGDVVHGDCPVFDVFVDSPSSMRSLQGGTGPVGTITYRNRAFVEDRKSTRLNSSH